MGEPAIEASRCGTGTGPATSPAWAELSRSEAPRLMRLATAIVGHDEAHDLVADTVGRVERRPDWPQVRDQRAYLTRAAVNGATDRVRSSRRRADREERAGHLVVTSSIDPTNGDVQTVIVVPDDLEQSFVCTLTGAPDGGPTGNQVFIANPPPTD